MECEQFHADRRTDRRTNTAKLTVAFRNFANAPKTAKGFDRHLLRIAHSPSFGLQDYEIANFREVQYAAFC
jgi:hypothetical protein